MKGTFEWGIQGGISTELSCASVKNWSGILERWWKTITLAIWFYSIAPHSTGASLNSAIG